MLTSESGLAQKRNEIQFFGVVKELVAKLFTNLRFVLMTLQ